MSLDHMVPLALWGKNTHTKPVGGVQQGGIKDYVVYHVPRNVFRKAATTFGDVRHGDSDACYEEITLQLFLQMLYMTANPEEGEMPGDVDVYPLVKAWLEWVPLEDGIGEKEPGEIPRAVGYNIHAVSMHKDIKFGNALNKILFENKLMHRDSMNRKMNSRQSDPLSGLFPYQKWMRVTGVEMYVRTICDRYAGSQEFTNELDTLLNPKKGVNHAQNPANPSKVFDLNRALTRLPDQTVSPEFLNESAYGNPSCSTNGVLQFPSPKHVLLLTPEQLHPKVFCAKYLPEHQEWMEIQQAIPQKKLVDDYDPNCQSEYDIRTAADIEKARLDGMSDRSAFANLAMQSKARYVNECLEKEHTDEFSEAYHKFQDWAVVAMERQCLDPDACISEVASKMLIWRNQNPNCAMIKHTITDPTLSVFANRVVGLMESYEQYYLMSTAHRMMFLIHHARYDAFRRDFGLHFNCFQAGDGACSKSFLFDQMAKQSIPGTIEVLTYQTGKADAVDGNRNDVTTVCHEAPPGMFRTAKNPNADSTQEAMFKEKLTSQRVTAKIWCQDEGTGKRSSRLTKSECVGVWMGATNDPPSEVEEALKTRFFWGNFEQQRRKGRDIDDCMNGERMMSSADKLHRKMFFREAQEEQFRVMVVEKAIWAKVIKDVNTTASNILIPRLKTKLTQNSIISPTPRDWERVKIFSRLMAIVTAIESVCNLPGGEHYNTPFATHMLPSLEPYLKVTEEMVVFTISLLADQFRSPVEHKILNTIWDMEKGSPVFGMPNSEVHCVDYVKLPRLKQLSRKINSRIPFEKGRTSTNNIENFIINMSKHSIKTRPYKVRPTVSGSQASVDKYPIVDTDKPSKSYLSCHITNDGVYVHTKHILAHSEDSDDVIFQILEAETHAHSDEKRLLTACPVKDWFHVMRVIGRKSGGGALEYQNVLANTSISRWITRTSDAAAETRTRSGYEINEDIDRHVAGKWATIIGKGTYTPSEIMARAVEAEEPGRPDCRYPDCMTGVSTVREKRSRGEQNGETSSKKRRKNV